jgi:hypothetical protein
MDHEQLRLAPDLLDVMRAAVTRALDYGARFVAPPHLLLALLGDAQVGAVLGDLVAHERTAKAAAAADKPPGVTEVAAAAPPAEGEPAPAAPPFPRYDTFAFRSRDGAVSLYLDADAQHLFIEGARRADDLYRPKHLALGFAEESVKDGDILALFGANPQDVSVAVAAL